MTPEKLRHANKLYEEIRALERFIFNAERKWEGRLIRQTNSFFFFCAPAYGSLETENLELDKDLKNKVLEVIRNELALKREELDNI